MKRLHLVLSERFHGPSRLMVSVPKVNTFEIARNVHKTRTGYLDSSVLDNRPTHRSLRLSEVGVRRAKAAFFSGCKSHPATIAPAGSNRSSHGGDEMAEVFG